MYVDACLSCADYGRCATCLRQCMCCWHWQSSSRCDPGWQERVSFHGPLTKEHIETKNKKKENSMEWPTELARIKKRQAVLGFSCLGTSVVFLFKSRETHHPPTCFLDQLPLSNIKGTLFQFWRAGMTISATPSIRDGSLIMRGQVVLTGVPGNVTVKPLVFSSAFNGATQETPSSCHVFTLGVLDLVSSLYFFLSWLFSMQCYR